MLSEASVGFEPQDTRTLGARLEPGSGRQPEVHSDGFVRSDPERAPGGRRDQKSVGDGV